MSQELVDKANAILQMVRNAADDRTIADVIVGEDNQMTVGLMLKNLHEAGDGHPLLLHMLSSMFFLGVWMAEMGRTTLIREEREVQAQ